MNWSRVGRQIVFTIWAMYADPNVHRVTAVGAYAASRVGSGADDGLYLGTFAGAYNETDPNRFFLDNLDRTNYVGDKAHSMMYGYFAADANDQWLNINADVNMPKNVDINDLEVDGITVNDLTASRLVATDASKVLVSSDLVNWVAGVANETDIVDDGDGSITVGIVDPLIVAKGGTGLATITDGGLMLGSGTGAVTPLAQATNGQLPIGSTGADPVLAGLTGTANQLTVTNGAGTITLALPQDIHTGASPTFADLTLSAPSNIYSLSHDSFADFVANEHIDWTSTSENFYTTGTLRVDGLVGVGVAPVTHTDIKLLKTHSNTTDTQIGADFIIDQDTASAQSIIALRSGSTSSHTSGTMVSMTGYQSVTQAQSNGAITAIGGVQGAVGSQDTRTPAITVMAGVTGSVDLEDAAVTLGFCLTAPAATKDTGSVGAIYGVYLPEQTIGTAQNLSMLALGDVGIASDKKLCLESAVFSNGDTYLVYDSLVGSTLDMFVNNTEFMNASTTTVTFPLVNHFGGATDYTESEADGTLEFNGAATVWNDINIGAGTLSGPPGKQPGIDNFVDEVGADTGIATYALAVGEGLSGALEIPHSYKEGSDIYFHIHWQGIAAPTGTDYVKFEITYTVGQFETTLNAVTAITVETAFDTQYEIKRSDFAAITGTNFDMENQFLFTIERIAAAGDAYAGEALIGTVGVHFEEDTVGSRTIATK